MNVLFVEDQPELHNQVKNELEPYGISITTAENAAQAIELVEAGGFDLFLCDLKIPASLEAPIPHKQHGLKVYDQMRVAAPGVPIIIFTAYGQLPDLRDRLSEAPSQNLYGDGNHSLVIERRKTEIKKVVGLIREQYGKLTDLEANIELSGVAARAAMEDLDERLVRIHARSHGAVTARMDLLAGGRSGARVLKLQTNSTNGSLTSRVVAKLNTVPEVEDELKRYEQHVLVLGAGAYTNHVGTLRAGAQQRAALFYALAQTYDDSLFGLLRANVLGATKTVEELRENLRPWHEHPTPVTRTIADIRRLFVSEARLGALPPGINWRDAALEGASVNINEAPAHGDLHGGNVLVNPDGRPILIDFGRVDSATNAVDPVTLELSAVLHPDASIELRNWPTTAQAEHWDDLEAYLDGCPIREYVCECRKWATDASRGDREIDAVVFAYALRQLLYPGRHHELAAAYSRGAANRLRP
jgi:CheY-like chemotaxis protein